MRKKRRGEFFFSPPCPFPLSSAHPSSSRQPLLHLLLRTKVHFGEAGGRYRNENLNAKAENEEATAAAPLRHNSGILFLRFAGAPNERGDVSPPSVCQAKDLSEIEDGEEEKDIG